MITPRVPLLFKVLLSIVDSLYFCVKFKNMVSISVKNCVKIFDGVYVESVDCFC